MFSVIKKALMYKNGSLAFVSFSLGGFFTFVSDEILKGIEVRNIIIPIIITLIGWIFFSIFFLMELHTGIVAVRKSKGPKWDRNKQIYKRIWKMLGVSSLMVFFMFFEVAAVVVDNPIIYYPVSFLGYSIILLVVLFEFQMIGNNIQEYAPPKPKIFKFMDDVLDLAQLKILKRLDDTLCPIDEDDIKRITGKAETDEKKI